MKPTPRGKRSPRQLQGVEYRDWTEDEFSRWVQHHAHRAGWHVTRFRKAIVNGHWITPTSTPFVDLHMIRPPRVVYLELKVERGGRVEPEQQALMLRLQACPGVEAFIVRPSDALAILRLLARPRGTLPGGNPMTTSDEGDIEWPMRLL